jgi:hypothetical protein
MMKTLNRSALASFTALALLGAAATGTVRAQDRSAGVPQMNSVAKQAASTARASASAPGRQRADVKAEAVRANAEHRTTLSESMDFLKSEPKNQFTSKTSPAVPKR